MIRLIPPAPLMDHPVSGKPKALDPSAFEGDRPALESMFPMAALLMKICPAMDIRRRRVSYRPALIRQPAAQ